MFFSLGPPTWMDLSKMWEPMAWTYGEGDRPNMGSEVLFDRPSIAELIAGTYYPKAHRCIGIGTNPAMNRVVLILD